MSTFAPITVSRTSSREEREAALPCIYQQILERQPYAFERKILAKSEKDFLTDKIGVRRFIKELALSEVYLNSFFHNSSNTKFLELCFKHFFGRAPLNHAEMQRYCDLLMSEGAAKMMTTMLDSEEYRKAFGCFTVPYPRRQACYESPKSYMQSHWLNQEMMGQRGRSLPTLYWHQLGLDCTGGVCHHPEANEAIEVNLSQTDLAELLQMLQTAQSEKAVASLSPQQKERLRRAIG